MYATVRIKLTETGTELGKKTPSKKVLVLIVSWGGNTVLF